MEEPEGKKVYSSVTVQPRQTDSSALLWMAGLVFVSTIFPFAIYTLALRWLQVGVAGILCMMEIPFAALYSFLFLGERLAPIQCIGALAVVVAVVALNLRKIHLFRKLRKSPRYDLWPRHGRLLEQTAYRRFLPAERPLHCPSS
jgi:drug/metabolite transporter (DMT)-like permease